MDLRRFYELHEPAVRGLAMRLMGPGAEVDDVVQDAFLVAWRKREVVDQVASARAWLGAVVVRLVRAARRRAKVRRFLGLDAAESVADPRTPLGRYEHVESVRRLYALLERVSEKKRTVFVLFELHQLTGPEIAEVLGCPLKTVWSRLAHARLELNALVARQAEAPAGRPVEGGELS